MAVSDTTRASLDFALEPYIGQLNVAWQMPKLFNQIGGRTMIERVDPVMVGAGKRKHFEWPIEFSAPFSLASGGGITTDETEEGTRGYLYPKILSAIAEIDPSLEYTESGVDGMVAEAERKLSNIRDSQLPAKGMHDWWGDGSGRRARVYSVTDHTTYSTVVLKPMWAIDAAPGCMDATKYIVQGMKVDFGLCDETAGTGAGSFTRASWGQEAIVSAVHRGTTQYDGADPAYINVTPAITLPGEGEDVADYYVYGTHPLGTLNGDPQGCARWIGDGYNARTTAQASEVGATYPSYGFRQYASIDRQDVAYAAFIGHVYNRYLGTPNAAVTLTAQVVDNWLADFYDKAPADTDIDVFVANSYLRARFNTAFAAQGTLYLENGSRDLGFDTAKFYDPYGAGGGRWKSIIFCKDAWRQSIWGFSWKDGMGQSVFYQALCSGFRFNSGSQGSKFWTDLRSITKERILRATGEQEAFLINLRPAASTVMQFVSE